MDIIPIIISSLIFAISVTGIVLIIFNKRFLLSNAEKVHSIISIIACGGGLITATIVVYSFLQTNEAFILSQRPQLLIQVISVQEKINNKDTVPVSWIRYENITQNMFNDLTISLTIRSKDKIVDLSYLFIENMQMIGKDSRRRKFYPLEEIANKGINLNEETAQGNIVYFDVKYEFTFCGKREKVLAQNYQWNSKSQVWDIIIGSWLDRME